MRIDGTQGAGPNGLNEASAATGKHVPPASVGAAKPAEALEFDSVHGAYVRKAAAGDSIDAATVAQARKLLESGQLDTPEAALRAADRMLDRGL